MAKPFVLSFVAGLLMNLAFLLSVEYLVMAICCYHDHASSMVVSIRSQFPVYLAMIGCQVLLQLLSTIFLFIYGWSPRWQFQWRMVVACLLTGFASVFSLLSLVITHSVRGFHVHGHIRFFGWTSFGVSVLACLAYGVHHFFVVDSSGSDRRSLPSSSTSLSSRLPFETSGIANSQLQLMLLTSISVWYLVVFALIFSVLEDGGLFNSYDPSRPQFEQWIYFCLSALCTIGASEYQLTRISTNIIFPIFAMAGLFLFGMILVCIRTAILEWIALRVTHNVYNVLSTWAFAHEHGLSSAKSPPEEILHAIRSKNGSSSCLIKPGVSAVPVTVPEEICRQLQRKCTAEPMNISIHSPSRQPLLASLMPSSIMRTMADLDDPWTVRETSPLLAPSSLSNRNHSSVNTFRIHPSLQPRRASNIFTQLSDVESADGNDDDRSVRASSRYSVTNPNTCTATTPTYKPMRRIQTISHSPHISSIAINTNVANDDDEPPVDSLAIYNLLQETLWRQAGVAFAFLIMYSFAFSAAISLCESWTVSKSMAFCFGALTTISSSHVLKTPHGRLVFVTSIIFGMGLVMYLGSVLAELISSHWKVHIDTFEECDQHTQSDTDSSITSGDHEDIPVVDEI